MKLAKNRIMLMTLVFCLWASAYPSSVPAQDELMIIHVCAFDGLVKSRNYCGGQGMSSCSNGRCAKTKTYSRKCVIGLGSCSDRPNSLIRMDNWSVPCTDALGGCMCPLIGSGSPDSGIDWGQPTTTYLTGNTCVGTEKPDPPDKDCPACP